MIAFSLRLSWTVTRTVEPHTAEMAAMDKLGQVQAWSTMAVLTSVLQSQKARGKELQSSLSSLCAGTVVSFITRGDAL